MESICRVNNHNIRGTELLPIWTLVELFLPFSLKCLYLVHINMLLFLKNYFSVSPYQSCFSFPFGTSTTHIVEAYNSSEKILSFWMISELLATLADYPSALCFQVEQCLHMNYCIWEQLGLVTTVRLYEKRAGKGRLGNEEQLFVF